MPLEQITFETDGANTEGFGAEELSEQGFFMAPTDIVVEDIFQTTGVAAANDAGWQLYVDGIATRYTFSAAELNPANVGRPRWNIGIRKGRMIQMYWDQAVAQDNAVKILYRRA